MRKRRIKPAHVEIWNCWIWRFNFAESAICCSELEKARVLMSRVAALNLSSGLFQDSSPHRNCLDHWFCQCHKMQKSPKSRHHAQLCWYPPFRGFLGRVRKSQAMRFPVYKGKHREEGLPSNPRLISVSDVILLCCFARIMRYSMVDTRKLGFVRLPLQLYHRQAFSLPTWHKDIGDIIPDIGHAWHDQTSAEIWTLLWSGGIMEASSTSKD